MLFQGQYRFLGTHADKAKKLTSEFDTNKHKLFSNGYEVFQLAPIVGFLYKRKANQNRDIPGDYSIFDEQMSRYNDIFQFHYHLIILLDEEHEPNFEIRVDKAFKFYGTDRAAPDEELYEQYLRGGVDVLYEKLIEPSTSADDYTKNLYEFMKDFEFRYGQNTDEILDLCQIARS
ncbi:hypothetical protein [Saccharibacillus endophyticus]|uniref:Uncharacterized protein n=1 Tax=Saccharibacillus endophyticus TaxID=2060666 RepID=A0ABQ1ZRA1_9BACL|nr:hypothetical protein [Saccharibacillus endophyticus]GGH76758.1 hypothetical protein GCM10007362_19490 [Saccharibacillus endophyticus]